jgi:hypothetical protein
MLGTVKASAQALRPAQLFLAQPVQAQVLASAVPLVKQLPLVLSATGAASAQALVLARQPQPQQVSAGASAKAQAFQLAWWSGYPPAGLDAAVNLKPGQSKPLTNAASLWWRSGCARLD